MIVLPADANDTMILDLVHRWVNLVAGERFEEATALTRSEGAERDWPPDLIRELIAAYEREPGVPSRITSVETARIGDLVPRHSVDRYDAGEGSEVVGSVEFDLPVNGVWSDLTALFWIVRHLEGLVLELYDIHVL